MENHPVIFYDGVCGFCNNSVQFVLKHDKKGVFRFAALQSEYARERLRDYPEAFRDMSTFVLQDNGKTYLRSDAALRIFRYLGGAWPALSALLVVPAFIRNGVYNQIAANRYKWFGKLDECLLPDPAVRKRFLG